MKKIRILVVEDQNVVREGIDRDLILSNRHGSGGRGGRRHPGRGDSPQDKT